ncbi:MAG: hypothetical protein QXD43_04975 [Candidatus Aenigmatarchaeota archaeon]
MKKLKKRKNIIAIILFNLLLINLIAILIPSSNEEKILNAFVNTDQPVYSYWNKEIRIVGSGFEEKKLYHIWIYKISENTSIYTGISFIASSGGNIPANIIIPITTTYKPGSYQLSVSSSEKVDNQIVRCGFGIWGVDKPIYQRTEKVVIAGGGIWPNSGLKLFIRNPIGAYVKSTTVVTDNYGEFKYEWKILKSDVLGVYDIFIDGIGTYDDSTESFFHKVWFTVIPATISISIHTQLEESYKRMQKVSILYKVSYPDQSPVTTIRLDCTPIELIHGQKKIIELAPSCMDSTNGIWKAEWIIPKNATLGLGYRFRIATDSFDDGFGNLGPSEELDSNQFEVTFGELIVKLLLNKTSYQVGFERIEIPIKILYSDGSLLTEGLVNCTLSYGDYSILLHLEFIKEKNIWYTYFPISVLEIIHLGKWVIKINVMDNFGNFGHYEAIISMEPWLFLFLIFVFLLIIVLALRLKRKGYWKIIYSKVKTQFE